LKYSPCGCQLEQGLQKGQTISGFGQGLGWKRTMITIADCIYFSF
jgi:hypothetical protein